jgi:hypothetical protein
MTQAYAIKTVGHMGLFIHTLHLYKVELMHQVTKFQTPPEDMLYRMNSGNTREITVQRGAKGETRAAT